MRVIDSRLQEVGVAAREDRNLAQPTVASMRVPSGGEESDESASTAEGQPAAEGAANPATASSMAVEGDLEGESFELVEGENHLGRGSDCAPVLNSRWISRSHARVHCEQGSFSVRAAEGKEVFVNDHPIQDEVLQDGDRVRLGSTLFVFRTASNSDNRKQATIPVAAGHPERVPASASAPQSSAEAPREARAPTGGRKRPFWRFWQKPVPVLVFTQGARAGERFDLDQPRIRIGGLNDNDIVIRGHDASRNHAELRIRGGRAHIWDLRSVNGTWVNERRIENVELKSGDVIRIGSEELRFED